MSETTSRYDAHADWYLDYTREWRPTLAEHLPADLGGQSVLDLACGYGQLSRIMAARGAKVTAVDLATSFVDHARELEQDHQAAIDYRHGDVTNTDWWDGEPFDGVVCNMALMDIDDLDAALRSVATVLGPSGWFRFALMHPCFPGDPKNPASLPSWPPNRGYTDEGWWTTEESGVRGHVGANHRMLSTYLNAVLRAGLAFDEFVEPPAALPTVIIARCHRARTS